MKSGEIADGETYNLDFSPCPSSTNLCADRQTDTAISREMGIENTVSRQPDFDSDEPSIICLGHSCI